MYTQDATQVVKPVSSISKRRIASLERHSMMPTRLHGHPYRELAVVLSLVVSRSLCSSAFTLAFSVGRRGSNAGLGTMVESKRNLSRDASQAAVGFELSKRVLETLDPCVVLMKQMISRYAHLWKDRDGVYSLAQGVVYWEPPTTVNDAISDAMKNPDTYKLHTYGPDEGLPELREALQRKLKEQNGLACHDVMVTAGANQAFVNCVLTLLSQGDKCVVFQPYYFNHVMAVQMTQGNNALAIGPCSDEGIPDVAWLEEALEQDKSIHMVTVVNPGNPTGVSLERDLIQRIVDVCGRHGVWLILDCTYEHFDHSRANGGDDSSFPGFAEEHVIHIYSFSKGHALAGFRCGYIVLSQQGRLGQQVYEQMLKVQDTIPICPARISQVAALGALKAGRSWVSDQVSSLDTGREAILKALAPLEIIMGGTGAMYIMGKLPHGLDDQEAARKLVEEYGVAVIPGSFCGFPGWIRVCYSNLPPEKCEMAAKRLADGILDLCASH